MNLHHRDCGWALLIAALTFGCGSDPEPAPELTMATIRNDVLGQNCSGPLCHDTAATGGFMIGGVDQLHAALVGQKASGPECANSGLDRVVPSNSEASLLYLKLSGTQPCGDRMPVPPQAELSADKVELVRRWIDEGAKK